MKSSTENVADRSHVAYFNIIMIFGEDTYEYQRWQHWVSVFLSKGNSRFSTAIEIFFSVFACCFLKKNGYVIILIQVLKAQELRLLYN